VLYNLPSICSLFMREVVILLLEKKWFS